MTTVANIFLVVAAAVTVGGALTENGKVVAIGLAVLIACAVVETYCWAVYVPPAEEVAAELIRSLEDEPW